jgi:hypothetical protein
VREDGRVERQRPRDEQERRPSARARDFEERVGGRSAERVAIEDGAPAIRSARSWREVHQVLAERGMRFERKGSGAILWVADQPVKASGAGRDCSMSALQKRLGDYEPAKDTAREMTPTRALEPITPSAHGWKQYIEARHRHYGERVAKREQNAEQQREKRRRMAARHRQERTEIFRGSWKGRGALLNATRSVLAARQAQERAEQRDRQKLERGELQRDRGRFPSYEEWLRQRDHELAQEWRHRERRPAGIEGPTFERPTPQDIRAFAALVQGWHVHYCRVGERGSPAFTDRGREIDIYDSNRREGESSKFVMRYPNPRCLVRGSSRRIKDCEVPRCDQPSPRPTLEYQPDQPSTQLALGPSFPGSSTNRKEEDTATNER